MAVSGWKRGRSSDGRTYYKRKTANGRTQIKWSANGKVITLAKPYKKGHKPANKKKRKTVRKTTRKSSGSSSVCVTIPKGKKKGDHFVKGGKKYVVVSFMRDGKRVRYARKA